MRNNKWTKLNIEWNKWVSVKELPQGANIKLTTANENNIGAPKMRNNYGAFQLSIFSIL